MRKTASFGPHMIALIGAAGLFTFTAAADVTVYRGNSSVTYEGKELKGGADGSVNVIAGGAPRETAIERRVQRFQLERKIQTLLEARDTAADRAVSDALLRLMARGNKNTRKQYSKYYPYHYRSTDFYAQLSRLVREKRAGVRVYRQSILDDVRSDDLQLVADALVELR